MSRIGLTSGFTLIPEGTFVFYIYDVSYDEEFGKMHVKMVTADGMRYEEKFSLKDDNDLPNERALNAFSFFAKTALNNYSLEEIDHTDLVGHFIRMEIVHNNVVSKKDGKTLTFANSGKKSVATEFDNTPAPAVAAMLPNAKTVDLDALLG